MRPRGCQHRPRSIFGRLRGPQSTPAMVLGGSLGSPGPLLSAPGLLWGSFWAACGDDLGLFLLMFETQGGVRSENSEKLEFNDPLNENTMLLRSQGLQNEAKMVPKRAERRKTSREDAKREQRSATIALQSVLGALWGDVLRFRGSPREGRWSARLGFQYLTDPAFRRVWALKARKSAVR